MAKTTPNFIREAYAQAEGHQRIAGVDEAGRGPLAGPVVAAAVVLDPARIPPGLADSKTLTAKRRAELYAELVNCAEVHVALASVHEIDEKNILRASHLAMVRALAGLSAPPDFALVDGNLLPLGLPCPGTACDQRRRDDASRSRLPPSSRSTRATRSWWIWRNSTLATAGRKTWVIRPRYTERRLPCLASPHTIGVPLRQSTISCIKRIPKLLIQKRN